MKKIVRMSAGLANRMLQYSYYLYLKKLGYDAYVDNNYKASTWKMEDIDWEKIFPNAPINQASPYLIFKYGGGYNYVDKLRRHYLPFLSKVWITKDATNVPSDELLKKNGYFIGVMQDASIAESVKSEVFTCFKFSDFDPNSNNAEIAKKMMSENSVSIHVRKGEDYMRIDDFHNVCGIDYYKKAISIVEGKLDFPVYYVFTDNPMWVKDNFNWFNYTLIENNPSIGWGNHFDMQLMTYCKHNIIANSTYSWWGAFLNPNPGKIVIDPLYWFNPQKKIFKEIPNKTACKGWILI